MCGSFQQVLPCLACCQAKDGFVLLQAFVGWDFNVLKRERRPSVIVPLSSIVTIKINLALAVIKVKTLTT